jgi:hypothetical protein
MDEEEIVKLKTLRRKLAELAARRQATPFSQALQ